MIHNASVPADVMLAHLAYADVAAAGAWLARAFGFVEHFRYGPADAPQGIQMRRGEAVIMLSAARPGRMPPNAAGGYTQMLSLFLEDVEAQLARAEAAGADIVEPLNETPYGELQFVARDPEGHRWLFARHVRDVQPAEWGAIVARSGPGR